MPSISIKFQLTLYQSKAHNKLYLISFSSKVIRSTVWPQTAVKDVKTTANFLWFGHFFKKTLIQLNAIHCRQAVTNRLRRHLIVQWKKRKWVDDDRPGENVLINGTRKINKTNGSSTSKHRLPFRSKFQSIFKWIKTFFYIQQLRAHFMQISCKFYANLCKFYANHDFS